MRIGVDLGGTKIEVAVLESDGQLSFRHRVPAPVGDYQATLHAIVQLVGVAEKARGARGPVGVGIPGTISPATGLIKNANSIWLIGKPFDRDLAALLGRPVRVANDANCFAVSEAVDGAGKGKNVVFGVILGTGVGGGIVVGGHLLTGHQAIAGEWGHNPLPWPHDDERPGPNCYCGKFGCIETFLGGPWLSYHHRLDTGETLEAAEIAKRATQGEAKSVHTMERYFDRFARALATVVNILDPDVVVLGGGLSHIEALYSEIPRRLPAYGFSDACTTPLVKNVHGDSGGVRGAAWLWPEGA